MMSMPNRPSRRAFALTAVGLLLAGAAAASTGPAVSFVSGGASVEDFGKLRREAKDYSLELVFAAKGSGAYLADVDVRLATLPQRDVVLEDRTDGPLLLAALPPGRYELTATCDDVRPGAPATQRRVIEVPRGGSARSVVYFDTGDRVGAESPPAYETH